MSREKLICAAILLLLLQGCTSATSVAVSGAQAIYNRHGLEKKWTDQYIAMRANQLLYFKHEQQFKNTNIEISAFNGEVLLAGQTPENKQRQLAGELIKQIPEVKQVYNLITIASPSPTLIRLSDSWITTKVKSKFIASNDLDATQIKVLTENGVVYLMGIVKADEADAAVDLARNTDGVRSVVKVFSYLTISKKPSAS